MKSVTEDDMIAVLETCLDQLDTAGLGTASVDRFMDVGEWLLAFEGLYVAHLERPELFEDQTIADLIDYFELSQDDLDALASED